MNDQELLQPLVDILAQSQMLLALANQGDWETMETQAEKYQQQVVFLNDDAYLNAIQSANLVAEAKTLITQIQVINDDLDLRAMDSREKIASELRQIVQSERAINAYSR